MNYRSVVFREFTEESIQRIERYRQEAERVAAERLDASLHVNHYNERRSTTRLSKHEAITFPRMPNKELATGETLPLILQYKFPPELVEKPIEEIDPYYRTEYQFMVISGNKTIFRFSSTCACYLFASYNCCRRLAIRILTHSLFTTLIILTILTNCVFMTLKNPPEVNEYIVTAIYTVEVLIKCIARGFVLEKHTFLRDPWNWLDFLVIVLAYVTFFVNFENFTILRTFRVLRTLKSVAILADLKIIVVALMRALIGLRDVSILATFILSTCALAGLQLYSGVLRQKCVPTYESFLNNSNLYGVQLYMSFEFYLAEIDNESMLKKIFLKG
ncbi:unnamed protein product [Rotaria magnacalcarata]|uniref:Ion transport domain-containing protein n=1 Tax=Rotaria magnacalcarata TaxID=392030 RepID=A0A816X6J6_9BILA|nr:unnamed protein product [Rotaria magnacalcarata]CAF2143063.1 unnamed protein product [Rotaria magnacalcarata]CAF4065760.1 unnamed protein product [Rotaria magnacalcarata]CAF4138026.1 unnamed protein product [Rotaria magnacalcarata]